MDITSLQNARIKHIVKLRDDKRQRQSDGLMLVEGADEIQLAISAGHMPQTLLTAPDLVSRSIDINGPEVLTLSRPAFNKISYRDNPDGWLGIFPIPNSTLGGLKPKKDPLVIVAESIEKPGNLGAILRTADSAGVDALLVCDPRVDIWNPNVVRASRGTLFTVPVVECDNASALEWLKNEGMGILAATPSGNIAHYEQDLTKPIAIAVGTEAEGLTSFWLDNADLQVKIPMFGSVNSLNVSVSTALIVYEAVRQRQKNG